MKEIYLIQNDITKDVKIGNSKNKQLRRDTLQTGNAHKLSIIASFPSKFATKIETSLHFFYDHKRKEGEWFESISKEDFLRDCKQMHENFNHLTENSLTGRTVF